MTNLKCIIYYQRLINVLNFPIILVKVLTYLFLAYLHFSFNFFIVFLILDFFSIRLHSTMIDVEIVESVLWMYRDCEAMVCTSAVSVIVTLVMMMMMIVLWMLWHGSWVTLICTFLFLLSLVLLNYLLTIYITVTKIQWNMTLALIELLIILL